MNASMKPLDIAIVLYQGVTATDFAGPLDVLAYWPGARIHVVAESRSIRTDTGVEVCSTGTFADELRPDVLLVPGSGKRVMAALEDEPLIGWVREASSSARWTTSVCSGSTILAAAGVLSGRRASTHWAFADVLERYGVTYSAERYVIDPPVATAAGVSAGVDMALALTAREFGPELAQAIQLGLEYDPQPPFDAGSPTKAPAPIVERTREVLRAAAGAPA